MKIKTTTKKIIFSILGIILFHTSFSQVNDQPGLIIKNNGDTLRGFIDYRNWAYNPDKIAFKPNMGDDPAYFKPTDLLEFRVKDEIYVSGIVQSEVSPVKTSRLDQDPQPKIKIDTIFLQTLIKGDKNLLYYRNADGIRNFFTRQDTAFQLLLYKRYIKVQDGKRLVQQMTKYKGQLSLYLNDCSSIGMKLKKTSYKQNSLTEVFKYYYNCSNSRPLFIKEREKIELEFGVLAGVSLTNVGFESSSPAYDYLVKAGYDMSNNITVGVSLDLLLPRNQRKWSVNNELLFSSYNVDGKFENITSPNEYRITDTELGYSYLKMNNMLRYAYPINSVALFLNGGISNGFVLDETNYKREETKFYSREDVTESRAINETRQYEQGFLLGTGLKYKALSLEMRFEKGFGISKYEGLKVSADRYFLLVGYNFNKKKQ